MGFTGVGPMYRTWPTMVPVAPWPEIGVAVTPRTAAVAAPAAAKENSTCFMESPFPLAVV
jgi:hypothetical protein